MSKQLHSITPGPLYRSATRALREILGAPAQRICLDAGLTCPTRDGSLGSRGCLYCDEEGALASHALPQIGIREQIHGAIARRAERGAREECYIAYLQAHTNTYASPGELKEIYGAALEHPAVKALAIGTRPDCLPDETLDILEEFSGRTCLWIEMGLQSSRNETLAAMERGHTVECFQDAAQRLRRRQIRFCAHLIFGLPGDSRGDMLRAIEQVNEAGAWAIKIHNLYIDRLSALAAPWREGKVKIMEREEYADLLCDALARLAPEIIVMRLVGEAPRGRLLAPQWCADKNSVLRGLELKMRARQMSQGCLYEPHGQEM